MKSGITRVGRVKCTGVKLLIQILITLLGNTVETAVDLFEQPIIIEFRHALASIVPRGASEVIHSGRCEIPVIPNKFQNTVINRSHPFTFLPDYIFTVSAYIHRITGMLQWSKYVIQSNHDSTL